MGNAFQALSDPTRRRILDLLRGGSRSAGELGKPFSMSGASISHHLSVLLEAGLVEREKKGQKLIYSLNTTVLQDMLLWLGKLSTPPMGEPPSSRRAARKRNQGDPS